MTNSKIIEKNYYLFANKLFYEEMDYYKFNNTDYSDEIKDKLDNNWKIIRKGIWMNCIYFKNELPLQGWKIHISTTPLESYELFKVVTKFLIDRKISFKFLLDKKVLRITNSKLWPRGSSGKFITIYPLNDLDFKTLIEELYKLTKNFHGPYILSDKRYKNSKVIYYRYGGIKANLELNIDGSFIPVLVKPDGSTVPDKREPYYQLPYWIKDIFPDKKTANGSKGLNKGRYNIEKAIHFSNTGGVYVAYDNILQKRVIIKEARPYVYAVDNDIDAIDVLYREYSILKKFQRYKIAPIPFDIFKEWEHYFLVEEYLNDYITLSEYAAQDSILFEINPTMDKVKVFIEKYIEIFRKLAAIIDIFHSNNMILGDLSPNNVLINKDRLDIKVIDLEGANEKGKLKEVNLSTPGFSDPRQIIGKMPDIYSDYYGFGRLMFYLLAHINEVLQINPEAKNKILKEIITDFGISPEIEKVINNLLDDNPIKRNSPAKLLNKVYIKQLVTINKSNIINTENNFNSIRFDIKRIIKRSIKFIKSNANYQRKNRLFPSDTNIFETNPLSIAHGVCGIIYMLNKIENKINPEILEWFWKQEISSEKYPPGFYLGISGISWVLLEIGKICEAEKVFSKTFNHPLLYSCPDIYYGVAGWGMTNIKFWLTTGKEVYIDNAKKAASVLINLSEEENNSLKWKNQNNTTFLGFAHGSSGIGLFFLYLFIATGDKNYKQIAKKALDYDISKAIKINKGGFSWPKSVESKNIIYPYWEYGSAGIGIVCLQYYQVFKEKKYMKLVDKIYLDCDRKYTIFPGRNNGISGIGTFLLDAFHITNNIKYLNSAYKVAKGLEIFAINNKKTTAFPGDGLSRISCDYATGISGIILFLHRLLYGGKSDFMLDELLENRNSKII